MTGSVSFGLQNSEKNRDFVRLNDLDHFLSSQSVPECIHALLNEVFLVEVFGNQVKDPLTQIFWPFINIIRSKLSSHYIGQ
jgi:hypothetical protein